MIPTYNLRDLRMLDTQGCEARTLIALVSIARGVNRAQLRELFHRLNLRFTNSEFATWRQMVFIGVCLSDTVINLQISHDADQTDTTIIQLRALRALGVSRDDARDLHGLVFSNDDWTAAL